MEIHQHVGKIHVAIGADLHEGFTTLEWTLKKWSSSSSNNNNNNNNSVIIVILYADNSITKDFVNTPIGKIPTSSLSDEKVKVIEKCQEAKTEKIISQYVAFCNKVKTEVIKIGKVDDPLPNVLVEKITNLGITKLVMAFSFIKLTSWKSKKAIRASSYIYRRKPDYCELYVVCEGRLVLLREDNDEGFLEDDKGVMIAKLKDRRTSFRGLIGKMFNENGSKDSSSLVKRDQWRKFNAEVVNNHYNQLFSVTQDIHCSSSSSFTSSPRFYSFSEMEDPWVICKEEIEGYFNQLQFSIASEGDLEAAPNNRTVVIDLPGQRFPGEMENSRAKRTDEGLKIKIREMEEAIQMNKKQTMLNAERSDKAIWAISLCTKQAIDLEFCVNQETRKTIHLKKELGAIKEVLIKLHKEVEEKRTKLNIINEIQQQLLNKLQLSSTEKARFEIRIEKSIRNRGELVKETQNMRRQSDALQHRIERNEPGGFDFECMKFTAAEIKSATDDFSEKLRLKSGGNKANVYKGCINQATVAVKLLESGDVLSRDAFYDNVKVLNKIRHPHILGIMGFCLDPMCIVSEYMHNGCLNDNLFSNSTNTEVRNRRLVWHDRVRIASEVCMAMCFLHKAKPWPITHTNLNPSKILLDSNNVAKIYDLNTSLSKDEYDIESDIQAFGNLLLQIMTGKCTIDETMFIKSLDKEWPLELAEEVGEIAKLCLSGDRKVTGKFDSDSLMRRFDEIKQKADELVAKVNKGDINTHVSGNIPTMFLCPIYQKVMKNPYVVSDGYTYERGAIEEWLQKGHDTSPMTNLKLKNKNLTPNHTLRSMIQDWENNNIPS